MEFIKQLNQYSSEIYLMYSKSISEDDWGDKEVAQEYLDKYYISNNEYLKIWKPIQDLIFQNQNTGLPDLIFKNDFSFLAEKGGVLFEREDFEKLQNCVNKLGDKNIIIIQNDFGKSLNVPPFRMKYPSDISWDELMSGNFISTVLFEMFSNEYFVFSESGSWGKYSANDYVKPLDIIGFKPKFSFIFKEQFVQSEEDLEEIKEWLPSKYI